MTLNKGPRSRPSRRLGAGDGPAGPASWRAAYARRRSSGKGEEGVLGRARANGKRQGTSGNPVLGGGRPGSKRLREAGSASRASAEDFESRLARLWGVPPAILPPPRPRVSRAASTSSMVPRLQSISVPWRLPT